MYTLTPLRCFVELLRKLFTLILDAPRTSSTRLSLQSSELAPPVPSLASEYVPPPDLPVLLLSAWDPIPKDLPSPEQKSRRTKNIFSIFKAF